jgi:acyl-homoserine lactone acylase PvdQ
MLKPFIVKLAESAKHELTSEQRIEMEHMLIMLQDWDHEFNEESIGATVYSFWQIFMYDSMFKNYSKENEKDFARILVDGYIFTDFFRRMME